MENEQLSWPLEVAGQGKFDFGAGWAQVHLFAVSMCQNHIVLDDCCGTPFCAENALAHHHFASNLDLFFAGSRVATILWRHIHTIFIENFLFICNCVATLTLPNPKNRETRFWYEVPPSLAIYAPILSGKVDPIPHWGKGSGRTSNLLPRNLIGHVNQVTKSVIAITKVRLVTFLYSQLQFLLCSSSWLMTLLAQRTSDALSSLSTQTEILNFRIDHIRYHVTEYCDVIGTHSTVWVDKLLYDHVPDPFPQWGIGSGHAKLQYHLAVAKFPDNCAGR